MNNVPIISIMVIFSPTMRKSSNSATKGGTYAMDDAVTAPSIAIMKYSNG